MRCGSLFSGIGGFDLAAQWMGWTTVWHSEIDPYACKVFAQHFPSSRNVGDVTTWEPTDADKVDIIFGGFPCQPVSVAGKRKAQDDDRWLWPAFARVLGALRPRYAVVENVPGLLSRGMGDVLKDLAALGYDAEWESIPASAVGAPHRRDRVWIVAHASDTGPSCARRDAQRPGAIQRTRNRRTEETRDVADTARTQQRSGGRVQQRSTVFSGNKQYETGSMDTVQDTTDYPPDGPGVRWGDTLGQWRVEPDVGRVAHGVPARVDRLKCLGNAIVPQVAHYIFQQIEQRG